MCHLELKPVSGNTVWSTRPVVSNIFLNFQPYLGKMNPFWRTYFLDDGLKPPTLEDNFFVECFGGQGWKAKKGLTKIKMKMFSFLVVAVCVGLLPKYHQWWNGKGVIIRCSRIEGAQVEQLSRGQFLAVESVFFWHLFLGGGQKSRFW